ncbi:AraC family transcriptional regulator [Cohnella nanjingensis]|uniref:AraC family transcriptional regulator n=1 Tax=Cohnella nanjingensis TaxID=1387779 RepID=A0A7X0RRS5_9BACL|nr:AraC family transcriptional regulator [Cohnella nanjingensis]MBB6672507.1 AraC family transcriptional regulator [Cohnella nanjingensis]
MVLKRWVRSKTAMVQFCFGFAAAVVLLAAVASTLVLGQVQRRLLDGESTNSRKTVAQVRYHLSEMDRLMKNLSVLLYADHDVRALMYLSGEETYEHLSVLNKLNATYMKSHPYLQSIFIYNPIKQKFYSTSGRLSDRDASWERLLQSGERLPALKPFIRDLNATGDALSPNPVRVVTYAMYGKLDPQGRMDGAVIVNLRMDGLLEYANAINSTVGGGPDLLFVYDSRNRFNALNAADSESGERIGSQVKAGYEALLANASDQARAPRTSYTVRAGGTQYLVTTAAIRGTGWVVLHAAVYDPAIRQMKTMKTAAIAIGASLAAALLLVSRLLARRLAWPTGLAPDRVPAAERSDQPASPASADVSARLDAWRQSKDQIQEILREQQSSRSLMKRYFLTRLLENGYPVADEEFECARLQYGLNLSSGTPVAVGLLRLDKYAETERHSQPEELEAMRQWIRHVVTESVSRSFACEAVDLKEDRIAWIVHVAPGDGNEGLTEKALGDRLREAQQQLMRQYRISVTISLSGAVPHIRQASTAYHQAVSLSMYRFVLGRKSLITSADIVRKVVPISVDAVFQTERRFIEALQRGDLRAAGERLDACLGLIAEMEYRDMRFALMHLAAGLTHALDATCTWPMNSVRIQEIFDRKRLPEMETIREFRQQLIDAIHETIEASAAAPNDEEAETARKIRLFIQDRHADPKLGVAQIAAELDVSLPAMNRIFENGVGMSIGEYIIHVRLVKAAEWMENSKLSLNEVMRAVGMDNPAYFGKLFKAQFGFTPREYASHLADKRLSP